MNSIPFKLFVKLFGFLAVLLICGLSCSTFRRSGQDQTQPSANSTLMGSQASDEPKGSEESTQFGVVAPENIKVGVILGPGGLKSFAHIGVLEELQSQRVPVDAIVGIEWGSLVAAIFAKNGSARETEWEMSKLKSDDLPSRGFWNNQIPFQSIQIFDKFLNKVVSGNVESLKIPYSCSAVALHNERTLMLDRGNLIDVIKKCMAYPPFFYSERSEPLASALALREAAEFLSQRNINVIILINVLKSGMLFDSDSKTDLSTRLLWIEIKKKWGSADPLVTDLIQVGVPYSLIDYAHTRAMIAAGRAAGASAVRKLIQKYHF